MNTTPPAQRRTSPARYIVAAVVVAAIAVAGFFLRGAAELRARTPVRWGGREYVLEPTDH